MERFFLYDDLEETQTRFVSFMGENQRYDLAIMQSGRFYGKLLVLDMQYSRFAILGSDDLDEPGYIEAVYNRPPEEAQELREYLYELIG
ncbi:DUF3055 domain-containing protein [Rummeliibacillus sp. G93]|uniref:Cytosolic protein n=1 Tax=Rummeliibacillus stabekisii TaxID=241244 RepID=A0A143HD89_9BACL|nr:MULTISPECIES: DUF3055 domain-containing protein [Rummeliibacillus]AMW99717.1 cytosolic protein [Rummeliibacillus stabekisii]MBB5170937.1 hypothetical protein [Rummeliibacillus stabekisii]MCM3317116.1 DUF3055 domain-containing protein [Rummeliibacillus stabekisii]UQW96611.1 DUF3055 domain-containing protein [Rummeliibacillus sp. G93]GEL05408.1 hypothetical protein RST01_20350 [Rummeliibacillus stabekisii]